MNINGSWSGRKTSQHQTSDMPDLDGLDGLSRRVSNSLSLSTSPEQSFGRQFSLSPQNSWDPRVRRNTLSGRPPRELTPFNTGDIKILLLENVNQVGVDILKEQGYQVETVKSSLSEDDLIARIKDVHVLGIRSKTKLTERVFKAARNLLVVGCFCIGTNQVDLKTAAKQGIAVFNSPFSNSRSVAELVISEIIALSRQLGDRNSELHAGVWNKVSKGCWEVRGKTLGIVGYGHIGNQLSVLAESLGMKVIYYDVVMLMSMGTAQQMPKLDDLLQRADFVTLHVPEIPETFNLIGAPELEKMKQGSYLINASRGTVVDIPALINALNSGKLAGAALDVYPNEPAGNGEYFNNDLNSWGQDLRACKNLILSPHIGGSTEEAQSAIGVEVANLIKDYVNTGATIGSVNMPEVNLRGLTLEEPDHVRVIFIHSNVPGVLGKVNSVLQDHNVDKQMSDSKGDVAYMMADISNVSKNEIKEIYQSLQDLSPRIMTRVLY